jgi:phosphoribosyl-AMP cyclohydrolase
MNKKELEETISFSPCFDQNGLIPCITTCATTGDVLMFAFMNAQSLDLTIKTGQAHYWSRSRQELWHKGATSGFVQHIVEMRTDCDQDCLWIKVNVDGAEDKQVACHTGRKSCFYREIITGSDSAKPEMSFIDTEKVFDPREIYDQ